MHPALHKLATNAVPLPHLWVGGDGGLQEANEGVAIDWLDGLGLQKHNRRSSGYVMLAAGGMSKPCHPNHAASCTPKSVS